MNERRRRRASGAVSERAAENAERGAIFEVKQRRADFLKVLYISVMLILQLWDGLSDMLSEAAYFYSIKDKDADDEENMGVVFNVFYGAHAVISLAASYNTMRTLVKWLKVVRRQQRRRTAAKEDSNKPITQTPGDNERSKKAALLARAAMQANGLATGTNGGDNGVRSANDVEAQENAR